jgi:hypothetical protein
MGGFGEVGVPGEWGELVVGAVLVGGLEEVLFGDRGTLLGVGCCDQAKYCQSNELGEGAGSQDSSLRVIFCGISGG